MDKESISRFLNSGRNRLCLGAAVLAASAALGLGGGGILAYATDNEEAVNIMTIGEVKIDLVEPNYPGNSSDEVKNLVPNQKVTKDPHIVNTGTNDAIVFMEMQVPMREVTQVGDDGEKMETQHLQEALLIYSDSGTTLNEEEPGDEHDGWILLTKEQEDETDTNGDTVSYMRYVYGYSETIAAESDDHTYNDGDVNKDGTAAEAGTQTTNLFDTIRLKNIIEGEISKDDNLDVVLLAYAIQPEFIYDSGNVDLTTDLNFENLSAIFDAYMGQNEGLAVPDADNNNYYGIPDGQ
ncbi:MAG: hypothetical protein LUE86_10675 [Clostridiales bacterium]|nr:hypothetical protein [Clostridiales bacterium]